MNQQPKREILNQIAEQAVPDTIDLWHTIHTRVAMTRNSQPAKSGSRVRRLVIGGVAAVLLALIVGAVSPLWNSTEQLNAQVLLEQAQAAAEHLAAMVHSYHLQMTRQARGKATSNSTEIWFEGYNRQRSSAVVKDANDNTIFTSEVIFNGAQVWIVQSEQGQTQVVHTVGTTWTEPATDRRNCIA